MTFSQDILIVLLIGVIAQATNTELATNTNFLLLLLLALGAYRTGSLSSSNSGNCTSNCPGVNRSFI